MFVVSIKSDNSRRLCFENGMSVKLTPSVIELLKSVGVTFAFNRHINRRLKRGSLRDKESDIIETLQLKAADKLKGRVITYR